MTVDELRRAVRSLPGVAAAEVTTRAGGPPVVEVWTDGTRSDDDVRRDVRDLAAGVLPEDPDLGTRRRGLGRSLAETLPAAFAEPEPSHLAVTLEQEREDADERRRFAKLAIEESAEGVEVRAIDEAGHEAGAAVGPGADGLTVAVASAVARLRGFPVPRLAVANTREVDGATVATVLIDLPSGARSAGAAVVTGGLPFTIGRAVDSALDSLR